MSKKKKTTLNVRKLKVDKKTVRSLDDNSLEKIQGGWGPTTGVSLGWSCPSGNLCCNNHNQAIRA